MDYYNDVLARLDVDAVDFDLEEATPAAKRNRRQFQRFLMFGK
ncbi:hypothetical protein [Aporhodopirellula aestuarii]|nr:hypothetical protein [Aporhodopirellula aestuarii]